VVERTQEQHGIEAVIERRQGAGIAHFGHHTLRSELAVRQVDMALAGIDNADLVAVIGKPAGMHTGAPANVKDPGGWWRQVAAEHYLGSEQLELAEARSDAELFPGAFVVPQNRLVEWLHRGTIGKPLPGRTTISQPRPGTVNSGRVEFDAVAGLIT
jgi:hypothetical protein